MKFFACSRCLDDEAAQKPSKSCRRQPLQEINNPLVMTKRPSPTVLQPSPPTSRKKKEYPSFMAALAALSRRPRKRSSSSTLPLKNARSRVIEPPVRQMVRQRPASRTQRLIKLYEDRAEGNYRNAEFLIEPPASFSGDDSTESHQNFKNKLNTLDFKKMNTVGVEADPPSIYRKNSYEEAQPVPICKFARKTLLEDFLKERVRIEQTMIDLLNGRDPGSLVLKKSRNDDKRVRFKEARVDVSSEAKVNLTEDGRLEQGTEIKLQVDPCAEVEDFYVERKTTYMKDKKIEDKALVLKIAAKDQVDAAALTDADNARNESSYENQNGSLKKESPSQRDESEQKPVSPPNSPPHLDYATDSESSSRPRMPCGSKNRRNRRHRQRKRLPLPCISTWPRDDELADVAEEESPHENAEQVSRAKSLAETKIDGDTLTITTEKMCPEELPYLANLSSARSRMLKRHNRLKIEKKTMQTDTQIYEVTTIRNAMPLEARLDHIVGVGIVEAGLNGKEDLPNGKQLPNVTVTEPAELVEPLPKDLSEKVENLPGAKECWTVAIPAKRFDFLEIQEVSESESDFETTTARPQAIVSEAESDAERESSLDRLRDASSDDESMPCEVEKKLRHFIAGLKLPSSACDANKVAEGRDSSRRKRASAPLGSQLSQEQNRCLDIIEEEEVEARTEDGGKQHIRDFINEEIGKFHRPRRDLRSVLRDRRCSAELDDVQTCADADEIAGVDETRLTPAAQCSEILRKGDVNKQGCDNGVEDVTLEEIIVVSGTAEAKLKAAMEEVGEDKTTVARDKTKTDSTFSQSENVVTFMNLVHSLTESVINDVRDEKTNKRAALEEEHHDFEGKKKFTEEISVVQSSRDINGFVKKEKHDRPSEDGSAASENAGTSEELEPFKENLEQENSIEEDTTQVKNNEANNKIDLEEIVIHSPLQYDSDSEKARITNEIANSDDAWGINNEAQIIDQTKLRSSDTICIDEYAGLINSLSREYENINIIPVSQIAQGLPCESEPASRNDGNAKEISYSANVEHEGNTDKTVKVMQHEQNSNAIDETSNVQNMNANVNINDIVEEGDIPINLEAATERIVPMSAVDGLNSEVDGIFKFDSVYKNGTENSLPPWLKRHQEGTIPAQLQEIAILIAETESKIGSKNDKAIRCSQIESLKCNGKFDELKSAEHLIPMKIIDTYIANGPCNNIRKIANEQVKNVEERTISIKGKNETKSEVNKNSLEINSVRVIPVQAERTLNSNGDHKKRDSEATEKKEGEELVVPIQLNSNIYKRPYGPEVAEELNEKIKERISPVQSEDWIINIERDKIRERERGREESQSRERRIPIKLDNGLRENQEFFVKNVIQCGIRQQLEERIVTIPIQVSLGPSRFQDSTDAVQMDGSLLRTENTHREQSIFISRSPPPPPVRCQRPMNAPNCHPSHDYIHFAFGRFHHRAFDAIKQSNNSEIADLVKALLSLLSSNASTKQDVHNLLGRYDLESLPQNTRCIIDEFLAPSLPRGLRNANKIGSGASFEIASSAVSHPQQEEGESPPPRPALPQTTFSGGRRTTAELLERRHDDQSRVVGGAPGNKQDHDAKTIASDEHLYYVPLGRANNSRRDADYAAPAKFSDSLKDLCIKKILSMPRGEALIRQIASARCFESDVNDKMGNQTSKCWTGVPTKDDPKVLVCFSPAQRQSEIKTSADNLLDLHRKFIDRHGYHHEHSHAVLPARYFVDVAPMDRARDEDRVESSRLLSIIKENPVSHQRQSGMVDRLQAKRLSDWLSLARRPGDDNAEWASGPSADSRPLAHSTPPRNATPDSRGSPIPFGSAVIGKSAVRVSSPAPRPSSAMTGAMTGASCQREPRHVNSALIVADRPRVPAPVKRHVVVDSDCIDRRSIFDRGPDTPRSGSGLGRNPDSPEQAVASEVLDNLAQLQAGTKEQMDRHKRYSLPQEYFDRQLKYIERLEQQLKSVIAAEEEERRAAETFQKELALRKMLRGKPRAYTVAECSFLDNPSERARPQQTGREGAREHPSMQLASNQVDADADAEEFEGMEDSRETTSEAIERREPPALGATADSVLEDLARHVSEPMTRRQQQRPLSIAAIPTNGEVFRRQMYNEYVHRVHEREERRQHKLIKISSRADLPSKHSETTNTVEQEFIERAKSRLHKQGIKLDDSGETEGASAGSSGGESASVKFLVDGQEVKDARNLPKHLQEFLRLSDCEDNEKAGVWSPGSGSSESAKPPRQPSPDRGKDSKDDSIPPVWTPSSAGPSPVPERKEFRPVSFESPILSRKKIVQQPQPSETDNSVAPPPPWQKEQDKKEPTQVPSQSTSIPSSRIVNSYSAPAQGLNALAGAPRLPRAQNPTITLLQKAREGQLPKGAAYLDETDHIPRCKAEEKPLLSPGEVIYTLKKEYESEPESEYVPPKKMADLGPRKYEGIGPTTRHGMPLVLRSEVKEGNQERWYKQMYNSLHRAPRKDDYVTIRYKPHRGTRTGYSGTSSGYLSEPEPGRSSYTERSATLDGRRHRQRSKENDFSTLPRPAGRVDGHYSPDTYHMNPGRIENYEPGNCSIQEKETKEPPSDLTWAKRKWWDEVMEIFDGWLDENGWNDPRQQQQQQQQHQQQHQQQFHHQEEQELLASPATQQLMQRTRSLLSHNVRQHQHQQRDRSLRGSSPLNRLYSERRELELRQLKLLESLLELNRDSQQVQEAVGRPRSGSTGGRIIRPLDWHQPIISRQPQSIQQQPLSSSASSSSSVTNSSSNGTSTNHVAVAPSSSTSSPRLPFEQSNSPKSYMTHALKESGYESDSTLVFRRREDVSPLSPLEQRIAYKTVQKGGDVPLHGLRKPAPERPKDDTEIEYFPISPTLTRIRVHRKSSCSSATASPASSTSSMNVSRIPVSSMASRRAHSRGSIHNPPVSSSSSSSLRKADDTCTVPSPPKRKSSRNNRTLKLYSNVPNLQETGGPRHEQCFVEEHISNIRLLKEKLNTNLEKHRRDREESQKQRLARTLSASPVPLLREPISASSLDSKKRRSDPCLARASADSVVKARLSVSASPVARSPRVPSLRKSAEIKSSINRSSSKISLNSSSKDLTVCQHASRTKIANSPLKKETKARRTKKEQEESCKRLSRSAVDLTSPVEVRRILQKQKDKDRHPRAVTTRILPSGTVIKSSSAPYVSTISGSSLRLDDKSLKVTVAISQKGREIFRKPTSTGKTLKQRSSAADSSSEAKKRKVRDKSPIVKKSNSRQSLVNRQKMSKSIDIKSKKKESSRHASKTSSPERFLSDRTTKSDVSSPALTIEMLRQHHEATMSDSFFQHLFLRDIMLTSTETSPPRKSSVLDRARMFQEINYSDSYKSEPSLKSLSIYLAHKRPVSNSRFKNWERESMSSRSSSPYGMRSFLSRFNKYDSLLRVDEFGSSSSLRGRSPDLSRECPKERSLSEPPLKTLPESPDSTCRRSPSPSTVRSPASHKIQNLRQDHFDSAGENSLKKSRAKSASEMDSIRGCKQTFGSNTSLTRSVNSLMNFPIDREDYQQYILERLHSRQKSKRYRDLYDFYTSLERLGKLEKTTSSGDLRPRLRNEEVIDYERWKQLRAKEKAVQELNNLYKKLKMVQKEKDFLFIASDVDRYRWRGDCNLRCKERSVQNIKEQFRKLQNEESELEASRQREIAAKKDTYKPLWRGNSVVNVASTLTRKAAEKAEFDRSSVQVSLQKSLGGSNKFWSSLSVEQVTALKNQLNDIYGSDLPQPKKSKPKCPQPPNDVALQNGVPETEKPIQRQSPIAHPDMKKNMLISDSEQSSLSISDYEIVVPMKKRDLSPEGLHVRCHSMITPDRRSRRSDETDAIKRSGSISRVSSLERSNSDRAPSSSPMSEVEKKRLSLTLGKEMLEKVSQRLKASVIKPRETHGALAAVLAKSSSNVSPRTCSSIETPTSDNPTKSKTDRDYVLVLTPTECGPEQKERVEKVMKKWSKKPPVATASIAERVDQMDSATESSDTSVKTVVQRSSDGDDLQRKVEFYEKIEKDREVVVARSTPKRSCKLASSQSFADLKDLFGESAATKYRTIPLFCSRSSSPTAKAERASGSPDVVANTRRERARSASPCRAASPAISESSSLESLWQRCGSPDPEKYWRTYLKLVRDGTVKRLRAKFESLEELSHGRRRLALIPKRFQSDPELARNLLKKVTDTTRNYIKPQEIADVAWLRRKYEPPRGRRRRGGLSPIPRMPWKLEDLTMPHINVISKTAKLKESSNRKPSSSVPLREETKELKAKRAVNRVREMFERSLSPESKTSLLGEMFTSAPNVHELRDIAPYLAGRWVAHQYPSRYDNSRSLSSPPDLSRDSETSSLRSRRSITPPSRKKKFCGSRASSTSPVRPRTPVSILKPPQQQEPKQAKIDVFANQQFDPSKHRPRFRYQPTPPPLPQPPSPKSRYKGIRTWYPPMSTHHNTRPTVVTFKKYMNAPPPPPPKAQHYRGERQESPRRYVEGEVTIHYRSPVRTEAKEPLSEEELARRSAENMRRVYQEERRRKYLQELHDIDSRRHTDNFVPSQKSPIPLNRYDDFLDDLSYRSRSQEQTPEPRLVARALYNFIGQSPRELTFRRGDLIFVRRQVDKNWYEGEHNAMVGLFPFNYVEIVPHDEVRTLARKPYEGQARAKFNFIAQTNLELSLPKGELVFLTRRVDENWYEGRIGNRKGIFPVSYVEVICEPGLRPETPVQSKPVASPAAHSMLSNGSAGGKLSMGAHHYSPSLPVNINATQPHYNSLPKGGNKVNMAALNETLHIDTHTEPIPYRALYNYKPQNDDELELREGDTVYVMEKCDDGWYVGSSQRTGYFGTFPGNYVERL
ncbi:uncharacterized protein LOC131668863 [Phymastichus coffea]|uniref:uncharacterized protein LOC131668863 n=1 Tax=Phymastichus coffea TaxID=108790 RepID=UPI00273AAB24|nr:uncharacterized protein LOC131668863 [Phymastichus coffea]